MKENKYDDPQFFSSYAQMPRSQQGLQAAGEWHQFKNLLPDFHNTAVLDLGCGYGWHCRYALENGAKSVVGVDISQKMIARAKEMTNDPRITYQLCALEDFEGAPASFDVVLSSLALHYVADFAPIAQKVSGLLRAGGTFVFSVEHPIFTASGKQDWTYDSSESRLNWPVDRYFEEGPRSANFLGSVVTKYHRTLTTYIRNLVTNGFSIVNIVEPVPTAEMLQKNPDWKDELRRPMMLLISAEKRSQSPQSQKSRTQ